MNKIPKTEATTSNAPSKNGNNASEKIDKKAPEDVNKNKQTEKLNKNENEKDAHSHDKEMNEKHLKDQKNTKQSQEKHQNVEELKVNQFESDKIKTKSYNYIPVHKSQSLREPSPVPNKTSKKISEKKAQKILQNGGMLDAYKCI